jgi:hypothetical protein
VSRATIHHSDQYLTLLREAHRRAAPPIGAPALIWHLGFWPTPFPVVYEKSTSDGAYHKRAEPKEAAQDHTNYKIVFNRYVERRWEWLATIDSFTQALLEKLAGAEKNNGGVTELDTRDYRSFRLKSLNQQCIDSQFDINHYIDHRESVSFPPASTQDTSHIAFRWHGWLTKCTFVLHTEFLTATFSIDLSKPSTLSQQAGEPTDFTKELDSLFTLLEQDASGSKRTECTTETETQLASIADCLTTETWAKFAQELLPTHHQFYCPLNERLPDQETLRFRVGTELFVDFRGLVLVAHREANRELDKKDEEELSDKPTFGKLGDVAALKAINRLWPLVQACHGGRAKSMSYEFVGCKFLDGRALYVSAIGRSDAKTETEQELPGGAPLPVPPQTIPTTDWTALSANYLYGDSFKETPRVKYLLIVRGDDPDFHVPYDRWQIGRLVHRMNLLGTLRIAAIRDIKQLRRAGLSIMLLGQHLTNLFRQSYDGRPKTISRRLVAFFTELSLIDFDIPYGAEHRITRSRAYAKAFERLLEDMRVVSIEGWQSYASFMQRRMLSIFDFIDQLGRRILDLRGRANTLLDVVHTRTLLRYQDLAEVLVWPAATYYIGSVGLPFLEQFSGLTGMSTDHGSMKLLSFFFAGLFVTWAMTKRRKYSEP